MHDTGVLKNPYHVIGKILVGYDGLIQLVHFYALARAGLLMQQSGRFGFPALPPPGGWQEQVVPLLLATGCVDALNVVLVFLFVFAYFTKRWWWHPLGLVTLTIFCYSAVMYAAVAVPSGAWRLHALAYWSVAAVFFPVFLLMILTIFWMTDHRFWCYT